MTKLTTDVLNKAMYYMLTKATKDEYLEAYPIDDAEALEEFDKFWEDLEKEVTETTLPAGDSWDIPSDW